MPLPPDKPIRIIVAAAQNNVIGHQGRLPWDIPEDWQYLLDTTENGTLILGRRCYEEFGAPPPRRGMIVLSRKAQATFPGASHAHSLNEALALARALPWPGPIWIAGGQALYEESLPLASQLYITRIHATPAGDTHFPDAWPQHFPHLRFQRHSQNAHYHYTFEIRDRQSPHTSA